MTKVRAKNEPKKKEKAYTPEILIKAVDECINEETNCIRLQRNTIYQDQQLITIY